MELSSPNAKLDAISPEEALQAFTSDPDLERLETLLAEFNLFDVLGITRSELQHSRVIAWLLNPRGSHGLRDHFLRGFLSQAATMAKEREIKCVAFTPADVDGWKLSYVEVARERHNIDILLMDDRNEFVCPIENKVGSDEHSDQLSRYLDTVEREYKGLTPFPIYLTPDGRKPEKRQDAERWIPFSYQKVACLIARTLEARRSTISASVANFLDQYERTLRRRVLDTPSDIDRLALQIYDEHKDAIKRINKARANLSSMILSIIESAVNRHAPDFKNISRTGNHLKFHSRSLEDIDNFHVGNDNPELIPFLDFIYSDKFVRLLVMPGSDHKTRKRLHRIDPPTDYKHRKRSHEDKDFRMYRQEFLGQQDYNPFDSEKLKTKVEARIQEFYDNDYWPLVNAIREEFGLPSVSPN